MHATLLQLFGKQAVIQKVHFAYLGRTFAFGICREDALHPSISGNKLRKLYGHFKQFFDGSYKGIVSVGGAFSNHLLALAEACAINNIPLQCIVRGEEPKHKAYTLKVLAAKGAIIHYCSRTDFKTLREKGLETVYGNQFADYLFVPEGGGGLMGVEGFEQIDYTSWEAYDTVLCASGTGVTALGLSSFFNGDVYAFPVLKGDFLEKEISEILGDISIPKNLKWFPNATEPNGYAKVNASLFSFIEDFYQQTGIALDPIYTGKVMKSVLDNFAVKPDAWWAKTMFYHSGGLLGMSGFRKELAFLAEAYPQFFVD